MSIIAEDITFFEFHIVNVKDIRPSWHVDAANVKSVGGGEWLKVVSRSHTLVQVIMQDNEHADASGYVKNQTVQSSIGLTKLTKLRNQLAYANESDDSQCTLFETPTKKQRIINFNKH